MSGSLVIYKIIIERFFFLSTDNEWCLTVTATEIFQKRNLPEMFRICWNMLSRKNFPEFPQCNVITNNVYIIIIITNNCNLYVGGEAR